MDTNETEVIESEETQEDVVETESEESKSTEEPKVEKPQETPEQRASRLSRQANQARKKAGLPPLEEPKKAKEVVEPSTSTGELDERQLEILDLKGISEDEDIEVIERVMKRTGQTLRQVLKDDYVVSKLETNKKSRDVKSATPSSTKRTGNSASSDVDAWLAKNERTGELPKDFELRAKVVAEKERRLGGNVAPWRK